MILLILTTYYTEDERKRVAQLYAGMSEGELKELAKAGDSLTDVARAALRFELSRRGLEGEVEDSAKVTDEAKLRNLVAVRRFRDVPEALLAKGILDSSGIESTLGDVNLIWANWFLSDAIGGVKLWVQPEDVEAAARLLDQHALEIFETDAGPAYRQPHCPNCGSLDVSFDELDKAAFHAAMYLFGIPVLLKRHGWNCHSCGGVWEEPDDKVI